MSMVKHFRELRVYSEAFDSAMRIFEYSKKWPKEEKYSLTDQNRRSSRSVCEQIAEAWRKRRYIAHFRSKLTDADSEAAETQDLYFAYGKMIRARAAHGADTTTQTKENFYD